MIRSIIVDDELSAIKSLKWEVEKFCKDIEVCNFYTNPLDAIEGINLLKPDCVFLDIEMPEMDGFRLLRHLNFRDFELIFTTAFDNYAIKAFKQDALDYLLKPVDSDDLIAAVEKVREKKAKNLIGDELRKIMERYNPREHHKIPLSFTSKTIFVSTRDISYCKSDGNYTEINFKDSSREVVSKKLKDIEELINNSRFVRVHHSYLVNLDFVKEFIKVDGQYLVLEDENTVPVSRSKRAQVLNQLNNGVQ